MKSLIQHLESKVIINDLLIKKMKYEVQILLRDASRKDQAQALAKKINNQLDTALIGLNDLEKQDIRESLIKNSFMANPNPVSEDVNYNHVFNTLTNYDDTTEETFIRLTKWVNLNTEIEVPAQTLEAYIGSYKIKQDTSLHDRLHAHKKVEVEPVKVEKKEHLLKDYWFAFPLLIILMVLASSSLLEKDIKVADDPLPASVSDKPIDYSPLPVIEIPKHPTYEYRALNYIKIYDYLHKTKDSKLTTANYLSTIDDMAASYNTDPLLLIAIIGHEQNFVPNNHPDAEEMINNPYNVFGSWLSFNTNFEEATRVCLNTIQTARDSLPKDTDLIHHLNFTYAEDREWYKGVRLIYDRLRRLN